MLGWALANEKKTVARRGGAFVGAVALLPFLGTAFIPEMKEGSISPAIDRVPNISIDESIRLEMEAMRLVMEVPGVKIGGVAPRPRREPADPAGVNEADPIVSLKPRDEWPEGWTQDDIADAIADKLKVIPGVQIVMAQPISDRVDEMVTGVRADVAVKVFGDDLDQLKAVADRIARVAAGIRGMRDFRVERVSGQQYLSIDIDRQAIARVGMNVADVQEVIETAIGGKMATEIFEGERRFAAVVRLPEHFRDNIDDDRATSSSPRPTARRCRSAASRRSQVLDGPAQISRETGKRRIVVGINVRDRDLGGFVAELQQAVQREREAARGLLPRMGRAVPEHGARARPPDDHRADDHRRDLLPAVPAVQLGALRDADHHRAAVRLDRRHRRAGADRASTCRCPPRSASSRCGASRCSTAWCWSPTSASCATRAWTVREAMVRARSSASGR